MSSDVFPPAPPSLAPASPESADTQAAPSAADLLCLQSAVEGWQQEREDLLRRTHSAEQRAQEQVFDAHRQLQETLAQLEALKRSAHAVRARLQTEAQAARKRTDQAQEALARQLAANEELRVANAELTTALEATQWRLVDLEGRSTQEQQDVARVQHELQRQDEERSQLLATVDDLRNTLATQADATAALRTERDAAVSRQSALEATIEPLQHDCRTLNDQVAALVGQLSAETQRRTESEQQLEALRAAAADELQTWQQVAAEREAELVAARNAALREQAEERAATDTARAALSELHSRVVALGAQLQEVTEHDVELTRQLDAAASALRERAAHIDELQCAADTRQQEHSAQLHAAAAAAAQAQAEWEARLSATQRERDTALEEIDRRQAATAAAQADLHALEQTLVDRDAVLAQLRADLDAMTARVAERDTTLTVATSEQGRLAAECDLASEQVRALQDELALARQTHDTVASRVAELDAEREMLLIRVEEMSILSGQLERECERLRRERASSEEVRKLKAEHLRLEARIAEIEQQHSDAAQRHSAAVAGYMVELNQRSDALHAREAELQRLSDELTLTRQACDDAVAELAATRAEHGELEGQLQELRAVASGSGRAVIAASSTPEASSRAAIEAPASAPAPAAKPSVRARRSHASAEPVILIHLEEQKELREPVSALIGALPAGSRYLTTLETGGASGRRVLVVNLLNRTDDPLGAIASMAEAEAGIKDIFAYCASGGRGFCFGPVTFFSQPIDLDACVGRLLESYARVQRLLAVSENLDMTGALRIALSRMNCATSVALDLRQFLDLLPMISPDVALVDLGLPRGEGLRLISRLRADAKTGEQPVAVLLPAAGDVSQFRNHAVYAARETALSPAQLAAGLTERLGAMPQQELDTPIRLQARQGT